MLKLGESSGLHEWREAKIAQVHAREGVKTLDKGNILWRIYHRRPRKTLESYILHVNLGALPALEQQEMKGTSHSGSTAVPFSRVPLCLAF